MTTVDGAEPSERSLRTRFREPTALAGLVLTSLFCLLAVLADLIAPTDPFSFVGPAFDPPSADHWMGTDDLGRDVFSGVIHGARTSLIVGGVVALSSLVIGTLVGAVAGFAGGWVDDVLMRLTELVQVMPRFFLALMVVALFGPGLPNLIAVLALTSWELVARVVRSGVLSIKELDYVAAARAIGASPSRVLFSHILPNAITPAIALAALQVGGAILTEAGLSFLGLGDPNRVSWGYMLNNAQPFVRRAWWLSVFPGAAVALTLVGINLLSDALNDDVDGSVRHRWRFGRRPAGTPDDHDDARPDPLEPEPPLLDIRGLRVDFALANGSLRAVDGLDLAVRRGEVVGIVGESGCGKTVASLAVTGLLDDPGVRVGGQAVFDGDDLLGLGEADLNRIRGARIAMIFQEPASSLNPLMTVGDHIDEALRHRDDMARADRRRATVELLIRVGLPEPERMAHAHAHELSGGMAQRVMIAIALAGRPDLLIADEPTTALDVTIQAQILQLLRELSEAEGMAVILITHDLDVVAEIADRVAVMYAGQIVEERLVERLGAGPMHPYTAGLLGARPGVAAPGGRLVAIPGTVPTMLETAVGCRFAPRCEARSANGLSICAEADPPEVPLDGVHTIRCWLQVPEDRRPVGLGSVEGGA